MTEKQKKERSKHWEECRVIEKVAETLKAYCGNRKEDCSDCMFENSNGYCQLQSEDDPKDWNLEDKDEA